MDRDGRTWFLKGMKDAVPIGLGYLAVAFTLGIASKKAGLSAMQASVMSAAMLASAGQFAGIGMIAAGAGYLEMVVTTLVSSDVRRAVAEGTPGYALLPPLSDGVRGDG